MVQARKVAIIGCGNVGASIAFALMQQGLFTEMLLIDSNRSKAEGEAMDLSHGLPYLTPMDIRAGDYSDISDCALVIVTAGVNQRPGETRLDLIEKNSAILKTIIPQITKRDFSGILLIVSNPVDVLTYAAWRFSGYPRARVIGSGTVLDTGRLKSLLGERLRVDSRSIHAFIVGEHGESELAVWSSANVSGIDLPDFFHLQGMENHPQVLQEIYTAVRDSAREIIQRKGATYYGIAMAVARIAASIIKDERAVLPVSVVLEGEYGLDRLCLSLPAIVGRSGLEEVLEIPLDRDEMRALSLSAQQLRQVVKKMGL